MTIRTISLLATAITLAALTSAACGGEAPAGDAPPHHDATPLATPAPPTHAPVHVDSIFPIEESLRRFREASEPAPNILAGGAPTRDALIDRFVEALAASDTAALVGMLMSREEFAWLYYPHTRFTARPYELAPELLWFQLQNGSSRGLGRLLDRLGGVRFEAQAPRCPSVPLLEGPNRSWEGCTLGVALAGGEPATIRLFGTILERRGTFKFVSYSNDF
ncbi:MAG: hypothetical protein FJ207_08320 [Gemmatimonadetes bacterium]|nr:hypothetical protein [Gemmatimonadota bacterium]